MDCDEEKRNYNEVSEKIMKHEKKESVAEKAEHEDGICGVQW